MDFKSVVGLTAAAILALSCQSNAYRIDGLAGEYEEGDTICLADDLTPDSAFAVAVVSGGKFRFAGETDTTRLCRIYPRRSPELEAELFLEPGNITVELSVEAGHSRVAGTRANDEWQLLTDSIHLLGEEVVRIIRTPATDNAAQAAKAGAVDSLHRRMAACIGNTARRNKGNELGRYIRENYKAPEFR